MFKCGFCKKSSRPRVPCAKIITLTQIWRHPFRPKVQKRWRPDKTGTLRIEWADDPGGVGPQIVKEVKSCPECAAKWEKEHA